MIIEISSVKGNSGSGSPVFSKPGQSHNKMYIVFNNAPHRKPIPEETTFDYQRWKNDMAEM